MLDMEIICFWSADFFYSYDLSESITEAPESFRQDQGFTGPVLYVYSREGPCPEEFAA